MIGLVGYRGRSEEEIVSSIMAELSDFYGRRQEDFQEYIGVAMLRGDRILFVDAGLIPSVDVAAQSLIEHLEKITDVDWEDWGFAEDSVGKFYYVLL